MADEKMNDKEDKQCGQESQASKETTSSADAIVVEEDPAKEAPESDQQTVRNRKSSSPTDEEVEPEGKRPRYAGSSSDSSNIPDPNSPPNQENTSALSKSPALAQAPALHSMINLFTKQLVPVIESWLQANIRTSPPGTTLSIPGVASPPRPLRPPKPPKPPGSKPISSSAQQQRMQQAPPPGSSLLSYHDVINGVLKHESELKNLKANANEVRSIMDDITEGVLLEAKDCQEHAQKLLAEVNKLKGGSDDLQPHSNLDGLQAEVKMPSEGEIATDDKSCSSGGRVKPTSAVDAEMVSPMLYRRIRSGLGSNSGKDDESIKPATKDAGDGLSKKDKNKVITETDGSQDEIQDDTTFQDERKDDYTLKDEVKVGDTSQDEMKDDNASQNENTQ